VTALSVTPSHNPLGYAGLKGFDRCGRSWSREWQSVRRLLELESGRSHRRGHQTQRPNHSLSQLRARYLATYSHRSCEGVRVIVDPRGGAASGWASAALRMAGARVYTVHGRPSGTLKGLAPAPSAYDIADLGASVTANRAHLGVALDSDGDRCLFVNHMGNAVPPEAVARVLFGPGTLNHSKIVVSSDVPPRAVSRVLSVRAPVGARNMVSAMNRTGARLAFESSDHYYFPGDLATSDGIRAAANLASVLASDLSWAIEALSAGRDFSAASLNVHCADSPTADAILMSVVGALRSVTRRQLDGWLVPKLAGSRVFIRRSGTESTVRFSLDAPTADGLDAGLDRVEGLIRRFAALELTSRVMSCYKSKLIETHVKEIRYR